MAGDIPQGVLSTREAREHLSDFLREARRHGGEAPVRFYGAQRRAEAAIMSAELATSLLDLMDDVAIAEQVREREDDELVSGTVEEFFEGTGLDLEVVRQRRSQRRRGA